MSSILVFPSRLKYRLFKEPVDFRNGKRGLRKIVFQHLGKDLKDEPIMFLFFNKSRKEIKALLYDVPLFTLLQFGSTNETTFSIPYFNPAAKTLDMEPAKLMSLLQGLKLYQAIDPDADQSANC